MAMCDLTRTGSTASRLKASNVAADASGPCVSRVRPVSAPSASALTATRVTVHTLPSPCANIDFVDFKALG